MKSDEPPPTSPVHAKLAPEEFPFSIEAHDENTGAMVWFLVVTKAGPIHVPGFAPLRVRITIRGNDGSVHTMNSDGTESDPETGDLSAASAAASEALATAPAAKHEEVLERIRAHAGYITTTDG